MSDYDFSSSRTSCACHCVKFIVSLGVLALILWLSLRITKPKCSIGDVYVRGLDKSIKSNNNATRRDNHISFQLNLKNEMKDKAVRYDNITLNFYYGENTSYHLGNFTFDGFKQGKDKEASKSGMIETQNMPWDDAIKAVSNGSKAIFRVDVSSRIKYKITFWYTKKHNYFKENKVEIDDTGKSSAQQLHFGFGVFGLTLFVLSFYFNLF